MAERARGMGRGLAAILSSTAPESGRPPHPDLREIPVELVAANPRQPRQRFDEQSMVALADSLRERGVLQPVLLRPLPGGTYELIAGERRWRAAQAAGLEKVPVRVVELDDDQALTVAIVENLQREDLNPLEEAAAYEQLLLDFGITQEELATRLGRSRPVIANAMRLLRLPGSVQRRIAAKTLSAGHARAVASLEDPVQQERLADRIVAEGLTVRMAEELAQRVKNGEPLLGPDERSRLRVRPSMQAPGMADLAERLSDRLETRVRVQLGKRKGKVLIEFATLDDLQRICDAIGLEQRTVQLPEAASSADDPHVVREERTTTASV